MLKNSDLPGSDGEHILQEKFNTKERAKEFYDREVRSYLTQEVQSFVKEQEMLFIATSDKHGECDSSLRTGEAGFILILDEKTLAYPDYRGNGVLASSGNIFENPNIGMLFVDFFDKRVGLHINGKAKMLENKDFENLVQEKGIPVQGTKQEISFWIIVEVEEAYIHCSKNIPLLKKV